ncbi:MAG TPA: cytochrome c oxidase accessory protein CcoG [Nevskiaceae bacterium]|nr:cytochrome c oxidase accessory protein CcoG [Nevskiaceae bacterium]
MRADPPPKPSLLYEKRERLQPRHARGRFQRLRTASMLALLGAFYGVPWLTWNGAPLVWFDLPHRRFHLPGLTLVPQDLILLSSLLFVAAITLFLFTNLAGRLWCGYACPQTVWTEAFLWIEYLCEGDRHARQKLDRSRWTPEKIVRRGGRHVLWAAFAFWTGLTFVAYFVPARDLVPAVLHLQLAGWPLFWSLFYGFATWGNAGFMREQVCKYMCPYARFQSAMFDRDTLIIAYDPNRGEPRKSAAKKQGKPAGDCTDCSLCVQVCPMGIDIRKGLQYECIACAACVDVCDDVMKAVDRPAGLIRYTTARADEGVKTRFLRPRTFGYAAVWLAALSLFAALLVMHSPVKLDVLRDRKTLVRERADGSLENLYVLKITNDDDRVHRFWVEAVSEDGDRLRPVPDAIDVPAGQTVPATVALRWLPEAGKAPEPVMHVDIRIEAGDDARLKASRDARFLTSALR